MIAASNDENWSCGYPGLCRTNYDCDDCDYYYTTTSTACCCGSSGPSLSPEEFEEAEFIHKDKKIKLSFPKGFLDYNPRQRIPLYSPAIRVNNGRRR